MKEGQTEITLVTKQVCSGCRFHKQYLKKFGRHPVYKHFCRYQEYDFTSRGRYIGEYNDTPDWCPVKTGIKNDNQ